MSDLKPLGSEKLQGEDKIKRILEIANFKQKDINTKNITESVVQLADGKTYGIEKEKLGYIIKVKLDESETFDYRTNIKNRRYHKSFSQALKEMNLLAKELNRLNEHDENIDLFQEQKKFVLKTPKPEPSDDLPMDDMSSDMSLDMDMTDDSGSEEMDLDLDLDTPSDDMGMDMDLDTDDETEAPEGGDEETSFKSVQKLVGKLGQKLRSLESQQGLTSEEIKYVLNSVISALTLENLTEEDKDDVLENFEEEVEYDDMEGDIEMDSPGDDLDLDLDLDMGMDDEEKSEPLEMVMDEIFSESKAEKVISKYYDEEVNEELKSKSFLNETLRKVQLKKEINKFATSVEQQLSAENLVNENKEVKFVGRTNLKNLIFESDNSKFKVTTSGEIL